MKRISIASQALPKLAAVLLLCGGPLADVFGPEPYVGLPLLAAAPLIAGAFLSFRTCLFFVVLSSGVALVVAEKLHRPVMALLTDFADVTVIGIIALVVNVVLTRQQRRLSRTREVAEAARSAVLPDPPSRVGGLEVAVRYEAALSESRIGGDLYAVQSTPFGVRLIIGDVRGKGLQAIGMVSVIVGAFRQEAEHAPTLGELTRRLDVAVCRESDRRRSVSSYEDFATAVLAEITSDGGTVSLVNRGHPPPCVLLGTATMWIEPTRPELPLGMDLPESAGDAAAADDAETVELPPGASLLLMTDGVTEARNSEGTFYALDTAEPLSHGYQHPRLLVDALVQDVVRWTNGSVQDDMAVMALTRTAE